MKQETTEYEFLHDKKDYSTRAMMEKIMKEIKAHLSRNKNVKVIVEKQ